LGLEEKPEDMDNLKKAIDEVSDIWKKKRDELYDEKLKEIEEGHDKWKAEQAGKMEKEQKAANETRVATSMRLTPDNDEQ
jgi:conjugal transfer/entry exclusion protein